MAHILVVDDEPKMTSLICGQLEDAGQSVVTCTDPTKALALIEKHAFDIIITDLSMPEVSGMVLLEKGLAKEGTDVIMMTAYGSVDTAVEAMKKGAADYLIKPFSLDELELLVDRILRRQKDSHLIKHYRDQIDADRYGRLIGSSEAIQNVNEMIGRVASTESTVLLTGKSGTGKELAARMVHDLSPRRENSFIAINCAAITDTLLESELFGHEKGAFTGATGRKLGRFELAGGGTIFLDEIGEMSGSMQSKLLRVLEERKIVRVGGCDLVDIDVRVVAATNRDLKQEIEAGRFREDLYYRLSIFPIELPALTDRRDDILELTQYFLNQQKYPHAILDDEITRLLKSYDWPGNVRELRNVIERATILAAGEELTVDDFSLEVDNRPLVSDNSASLTGDGLDETERQMIIEALKKTDGNKSKAARLLNISRRRLYSRMKAHHLPL
ncbi:MAG: sigma-54-dependent Fis family transcriptional regulator [Candidatus Zixiibacteriota bacterium]|nr:MAG: sigma-54-dependent Fis family transcriptional regulator [candidate division Zixibacteria bacterium]